MSDITDKILTSSAFLLGNLVSQNMRREGISPFASTGEQVILIDADYLFEKDEVLREKISQGYKIMVDYVKNTLNNLALLSIEQALGSFIDEEDEVMELGRWTKDMYDVLIRYFSSEPTGIYEFRLNPVTAKFNYNKIQQIKEYGQEHYIVQSYGDRMVDLPFSGTTGSLFPPRKMIEMGFDDVRLSFPYYKLLEFEKFYLDADRMIVIVFFDFMMFGYITSFSYSFDANNPRKVNYDLGLKFDPRSKFHIFSTDIGEYLSKLKGLSFAASLPTTLGKIVHDVCYQVQV